MPHTTKQITTTLALLLLLLATLPARAAVDSIDEDTRDVLDPHAGPSTKLAALHRLADRGGDARRAIPALVQQTHRGSKLVRDTALETLYRVAGPQEAMRLITAFPADFDPTEALRQELLVAVTGWRSADTLRTLLASDVPGAPRAALAVAVELARADPAGLKSISEANRAGLVASLNAFDKFDPTARSAVLDLFGQSGPARGPAVHLLLRIAADEEVAAPLRDRAGPLLAAALDRPARTPDVVAALAT